MSPTDFQSTFQDMVSGELPSPYDPTSIARWIVRRDQRRMRILAGFCLLFWLVGAVGMLTLVLGLDRLVIFLRIADGLPWSFHGNSSTSITSGQEQMFWGTDLIHHGMPFVEGSVVALALAALFTVLLVFSSWKATLNRMNFSVAQIAEQLKQTPPSAAPAAAVAAAAPAIPLIDQEKPRKTMSMTLAAVAATAVVCAIIFTTGRWWPGDRNWQGYPRLSPFEAIRWQDQTPQVRVGGNWYELLAIDDLDAHNVVAFSQFRGADTFQKHFDEDLVELLARMGHDPGTSVTLKVKNLSSGTVQTLKDVPMTEQNRDAIWQVGVQEAPATLPSPAP